MRMIFSSGSPAILRHSSAASSSSANTVISRRLLVEREVLGEQLPGEQDRALLEIIAEGEIAEHLEEGVVAGGVADIVEVVVLAAGAHAFLRRGRAQGCRLLGAGEHVLERHHAGIGEHQGRDRGAARAAPTAPPRGRSWRRNRESPSGCRWCSSWQDGYGSTPPPSASSARLAAGGWRLVSFAPLVLAEVMAALAGGLEVERDGRLETLADSAKAKRR